MVPLSFQPMGILLRFKQNIKREKDDFMKKIYLSIDRIERDWVICENDAKEMKKITRSQVDRRAREGDVIYFNGSVYCIDEKETQMRRNAVIALQKQILKGRG